MQENSSKAVTLYCDGSCLGNPGAGGYGGILDYKGKQKRYSGGNPYTTNNQMEIQAVIEGLKLLKEPCRVEVVTDSNYVARAINEWLVGWVKKDFKDKKNVELWREYLEVSKPHKVHATWVKAHNGHPQNEECDTMAREEATKQQNRKSNE
ncbi:MAG: ribonuclease HI [Campylobacterales bacterium]|nr:ribonuclease HI [Campylobacterales bacterium]